jgi:Uma2 family endonuclease
MSTVNTPAEQRIVLDNISWETYLSLANDTSRKGKRICYDQGVMEIMAPGMLHENVGRLVGRMVEAFTEERGIDAEPAKSTTFQRDDLERGFEADESYYLANAPAVRGKEEIDLAIDPPPDLAIEIDISRKSMKKLDLYCSIGVSEVWICDGEVIHVYVRRGDGYESTRKSDVLPQFPLEEAERTLERRHSVGQNDLLRSFRQFIRERV